MNLSFQLYSARHVAIDRALALISAAGYQSVEAYRDNLVDMARFRRALDDTGLSVASLHVNLAPLRKTPQASVDLARELGVRHVVCPYLEADERPVDAKGWTGLARELSDIGRYWTREGFTFAWHNHDFEFVPLSDGTVPMMLLLDQAPELQWEIDAAWIVRAGADPMPWVERHLERISAVHLKDIAPPGQCEDEDGWADVGHGVVAWPTLLPLLRRSPAQLYAVEHDNPSDLERFARRSMDGVRAIWV